MPKRDIIQTTQQQQLTEIVFLGYEIAEIKNTTANTLIYYVLDGEFRIADTLSHQHQSFCLEPGHSRKIQCLFQGSLLEISLKEDIRTKTPDTVGSKSLWIKPPRTL